MGTGEVEGTKQDSARPVCFLCFLLSPLCHAAPLLCKCTNSPSGPFFSTGPLSGRHGKLKNDSGAHPKSLAAGKRVHKTVSSFSPSCTNPSTVPFTCMPQKQVHVPETNLHCVKRLFLYCFFIFFLTPSLVAMCSRCGHPQMSLPLTFVSFFFCARTNSPRAVDEEEIKMCSARRHSHSPSSQLRVCPFVYIGRGNCWE